MPVPFIRAALATDLPTLVDLQNAASPDLPTTLAIQEFRDRDRRKDLRFVRLVAEQEGQVTGVATAAEMEQYGAPGRFAVAVTVHPQSQRRGIGTALYGALWAEIELLRPASLIGRVREDRTAALAFASARGYTEVAREQFAELDLALFDPARVDPARRAPAPAEARSGGYRLSTFADYIAAVGADAAWKHLHALDLDASRDEPVVPGETLQVPDPERYRERAENEPGFDASLWFVAEHSDGLAALTQLSLSPVPGRMNTGFTAVGRAHRGKHLAWALKYLALAEAVRRGATTVRTINDATNHPMRHINTGLGFVPIPAYLTMRLQP